MKNLIKFSFIGVLAAFSLAQAADIDTVTVRPDKRASIPAQRYVMPSAEFGKFKREYQLSNGMKLALYNIGPMLYAQVNDQPRERVVATSGSTFTSTKSGLKMHIEVRNDDDVVGEVYIPVASPKVALGEFGANYIVATLL